MDYDMRSILVYFSYKYEGDVNLIFKALKNREPIDDDLYCKVVDMDLKAITILDYDYPECFKTIFQPPVVIFYKGDVSLLNENNLLSIVGSRENTDYGEKALKKVLNELFEQTSITIVSGLAKGIDTLAHKIALEHEMKTIAVLGTGLDEVYPIENEELFLEIEEKGLLISEYPPYSKGKPSNFPFRNRLIAGLGKATVVIEAKKHSGTRTTVRYALENGKDVYAVPKSILEESLCNELIKDGAIPLLSGYQLKDDLF